MSNYTFRGEDLDSLFEVHQTHRVSSCLVCGGGDFKTWATSGPFVANKCVKCGFVFMAEQLDDAGLTAYYSDYIGRRRLNNELKMSQRGAQYVLDAALIRRFVGCGNVLDVGCNGGFFLSEMGDRYTRYGTEVDGASVEYCQLNYPSFADNVFHGSFSAAMYERQFFDLVMMRGVVEHVPDPLGEIMEASRVLKTGGCLYICATPNVNGFVAELYRANWSLFHPVQHLWYFSPDTIASICDKYGLKLVWEEYPYLGTPYENAEKDIRQVADYSRGKDGSVSPPFWESMMSLVFQKK